MNLKTSEFPCFARSFSIASTGIHGYGQIYILPSALDSRSRHLLGWYFISYKLFLYWASVPMPVHQSLRAPGAYLFVFCFLPRCFKFSIDRPSELLDTLRVLPSNKDSSQQKSRITAAFLGFKKQTKLKQTNCL